MSATTTGAVAQSKNDIPWNKHVRQKKTPGDLAVDFVIVLLLVFTVVAVLYPLWFVVIASFSDPNAVAGGEVTLLPKGVTFVGYAKVFANHRIWQGYLNTIIYSVVGTAVNMAVTIPCAFALSRREFKPRRVIMFLFTVTMFISGGLIPSYMLNKSLGIINSRWIMILGMGVGYSNLVITRTYYQTSIPTEVYESAYIDGATEWQTFLMIAIPLSGAIIAVMALYAAVGTWGSWYTAFIYITDQKKWPLQLRLRQILILDSTQSLDIYSMTEEDIAQMQHQAFLMTTVKYAIIFVACLPMLVLYPFVQKYFVKGVMIGSVKG